MSTETTFRIGGWYRRMDNEVVLLGPMDYWDVKEPSRSFGVAYRNGDELDAVGYICLQSGRYCAAISEAVHSHHLLPGELHQVNGSWVPVEEKPTKSTAERLEGALLEAFGKSEPKRAPLDWNKPTPFDPFKGWAPVLRYDANEGGEAHNHSSPFQRISPIDRDPKNGSAFLKEMKG